MKEGALQRENSKIYPRGPLLLLSGPNSEENEGI